ncbi:MAG: histidine kinase, partial [Bacteroidota bacterium]
QTLKEIFYPIDQHQIICNIQRGEKHTFGLARIGPEGMSMQKPLPIADVRRVVYQASQERYCMVTAQGDIWLLDQSLALIKKITAYQQRSNQVPSFYISEALIHQGYLWVGVDPLGVLYRSLGQNQFSTRKFAQEPPAIIKNIFTDSNKRLYAYVLGKGLQVFGPDGDVISDSVDLPPPLRSPDIFAGFNGLEQVGPDQFVLSGKSVFGKLDLQTMSWTDYLTPLMAQISDKESSQLYLFYEALGDQDALVASGHCLYDFQLSSKQFQKRFCLDVPITFVMAEETGFWIGTTAGLYQCQGQDCRALPSYQGSIVKDIRRDADGRLLVATSTGLYVQTEELRIMDQKSGLGNSYVYGSLTDDKGFIWVSTNQGLSQIDPRDWSVRNYSKKDGISATEFNSYGYWKAPDGVLYFSGIGGITRIAPGADKQFQDSIPLVLTGLAINDRLPGRLQPGDELVRLSSDQNTITIHFQELLLPSQEKLLYEYQLAGFDKHWVVSDQSAVRYPQLPPGRYTFRLKLANQEQTTEQSLQILIALPLYRQSWFLASLLGLLFLGLGVAWWLYHRRQQQRQEEQQKQQAALEGERRRISRELHDNMGAHTTALISNIQRLQQQSDSPARSQQLDRMQQDAKNILSSLRDTIWILNNKKIYLTELIDNVKMFALRLSGHQSQYQLVVNEKVEKDVLLEASQVVHLKAMLQEIIHNTIKHADGDQIVFNIWVNEQIELHLIDNGKGFRAEETMAGQGLENLQWRAREIHCQMEFKSSEQGTHYQLKIPLAPSKKS